MSKLYNLLAIFAISSLLASTGVLGYLVGAGKLSPLRAELIARVLRGELDAPPPPASQPAASQPAEEEPRRARTADEVREMRRMEHLESLRLERARRDLAAQKELLDQALAHLVSEQEGLVKQRDEFEARRKRLAEADKDVGFQRELQYIAGLQPKQAKEHLLRSWAKQPADAVRLMMKLDVSKGKRILEQFKTPQEIETMHELLEQVRRQDSESDLAKSGTARGEAEP